MDFLNSGKIVFYERGTLFDVTAKRSGGNRMRQDNFNVGAFVRGDSKDKYVIDYGWGFRYEEYSGISFRDHSDEQYHRDCVWSCCTIHSYRIMHGIRLPRRLGRNNPVRRIAAVLRGPPRARTCPEMMENRRGRRHDISRRVNISLAGELNSTRITNLNNSHL